MPVHVWSISVQKVLGMNFMETQYEKNIHLFWELGKSGKEHAF